MTFTRQTWEDSLSQVLEHLFKKEQAKNPYWSLLFAIHTKERFLVGEKYIFQNDLLSVLYSIFVLKSKLPNKQHNRIILRSFNNKAEDYCKLYYDFLNNPDSKFNMTLTSINLNCGPENLGVYDLNYMISRGIIRYEDVSMTLGVI